MRYAGLLVLVACSREPPGSALTDPNVPGVIAPRADDGLLPAAPPLVPRPGWVVAARDPTSRIAGHVRVDGTAVRDALVMIEDRFGPIAAQRTRDDGSFDFGPRKGAYTLTVAARNAVPQSAAGSASTDFDLRKCTAAVRGHVLDEAGAPIANATAAMSDAIVARTDSAGAYEMCTEEGEQTITFASPGRGAIYYTVDVVGLTEHDAILAPGVELDGRVVGPVGEPIPNALVSASWCWGSPDGPAGQTVLADYNGRFRIIDLAPSLLRLDATGATTNSRQWTEHQLPASGSRDVVLPTETRTTIRGRLVENVYIDGKGKPVAGVTVYAFGETDANGFALSSLPAVTESDGSFVVRYAPTGKVRVRVTEGYSGIGEEIVAIAPEHPTPITVDAGARGGETFRGRVTYQGRPFAGARICCPDPTNGQAAYSNNDGTYVLRDIALDIELEHTPDLHTAVQATFGDLASRIITSEDEDHLDPDAVDFVLEANTTAISGTLVDEKGAPLAHVWISCRSSRAWGAGFTDARGRFRCGSLEAARYSFRVATTYYADDDGQWLEAVTAFPTVDLATGEDKHVALAVRNDRKQLTIAGRVVDARGAPVANARVRALDRSRSGFSVEFQTWMKLPTVRSDTAGNFSFAPLDAGRYDLEAVAPDGRRGTGARASPDATPLTIVVGG